MGNDNVCVATVTFNRKDYLLKLLDALSEQSCYIKAIYIVDNHSEDGTRDALGDKGIITEQLSPDHFIGNWCDIKIDYYYNETNTGGSGGFEKVFQIASSNEHDYLWAMDDDVRPEKDCLEILLSKMDREHRVVLPSRTDERFTDYISVSYNLTNPFVFRTGGRLKTVYSTELT